MIDPLGDAASTCAMAGKWKLDQELAGKLTTLARLAPFPVSIFSGYRTAETQAGLEHGAPDDLSTHRSCPATGADVRPGVATTNAVKATLGAAGTAAGLRWGGGAPVTPEGIPVDPEWMHFDLGPRQRK